MHCVGHGAHDFWDTQNVSYGGREFVDAGHIQYTHCNRMGSSCFRLQLMYRCKSSDVKSKTKKPQNHNLKVDSEVDVEPVQVT